MRRHIINVDPEKRTLATEITEFTEKNKVWVVCDVTREVTEPNNVMFEILSVLSVNSVANEVF